MVTARPTHQMFRSRPCAISGACLAARVGRKQMQSLTRLLLTGLAGYCDTVTFIEMKGVFSAHVTGNFVLFAAALTRGLEAEDYLKLATVPVFLLAIVLTTVLVIRTRRTIGAGHYTGRVLLIVGVIFSVCTALAAVSDPSMDIVITLLVVFALGMQNTLHHFLPGPMTTVMTGTVMNTVAAFTERLMGAVPPEVIAVSGPRTIALIAMFAGGCAVGAFAVANVYFISLAVPALVALWLAAREGVAERGPEHV